jgi:hypothetical protein
MRAQTTLDFAIGVTVFLAVLIFAFGFVPGILEPFELGNDEHPKLSDRIADSLAQEKLGSPATPEVLDRECTVAFFNESDDGGGECNFDEATLAEEFDLSAFQNANVTIEGNITDQDTGVSQLCWTEDSPIGNTEPGFVERNYVDGSIDCDTGSGDIVLAAGQQVPDQTAATISARRVVLLNGESVVLQVVLW